MKCKWLEKINYRKKFDLKRYIDKGYIDINDNAIFFRSRDICNCFGRNYKGWIKGTSKHKYNENVDLWFPNLYKKQEWKNEISQDDNIICEYNINKDKNEICLKNWLNSTRQIRYVFAKYKNNDFGKELYHFKGVYKLNQERTKNEKKAIWERISTRVETVKDSK